MDILLRKAKNDRNILIGYITAFLFLFIIYLISVSKNKQLTKLAERVDHTATVINQLDGISGAMKDAENGMRGYIITGDKSFLTPYYGTQELADSLYILLLEQTTDNKVQQQRLARLKRSIDRRFQMLQFALDDYEGNRNTVTDSMRALQPEAKKVTGVIRSTIDQMKAEEYTLLHDRQERFARTSTILNLVTYIALAISIGLAIFVIITYYQAMKDRRKGLERIREYQAQLTAHIAELDNANKQLVRMRSQEKFTATGRIARTIAHEVRNPLTNINLATEQLKTETGEGNEHTAMFFEMIERNSNRINQLISDLLNSTKFSELNYQKLSVNELLDEALLDAADRLALGNVQVTKKFTNDICTVAADKERMKIAFLNIIINAAEAMEQSAERNLVVETKAEQGKCKVIIRDTGPGLDNESVNRLFEPYFTSKPKGNGLGLTNTQNIILNHKGEISVESEPGKGTAFIILLDFST